MRFLRAPHGDCDDDRVRRYVTGRFRQETGEPPAPEPSLLQRTGAAAMRALALMCSAMLPLTQMATISRFLPGQLPSLATLRAHPRQLLLSHRG